MDNGVLNDEETTSAPIIRSLLRTLCELKLYTPNKHFGIYVHSVKNIHKVSGK